VVVDTDAYPVGIILYVADQVKRLNLPLFFGLIPALASTGRNYFCYAYQLHICVMVTGETMSELAGNAHLLTDQIFILPVLLLIQIHLQLRNVTLGLIIGIVIPAAASFDTNWFVKVKDPIGLRLIAVLDTLVIGPPGKRPSVDHSFQRYHRRFIGHATSRLASS
jgi:hypothetical protein